MNQFTLLTFNCFGIPVPAARRRLLALAGALDQQAATVVCLQEVQAHPYRRLLTHAATTFPYHAFAPHLHAPRGGLLTLARTPIVASAFADYRDRGRWYSPALADVALAKGVLRTQHVVDGQEIIVLNTHLSANYRGDWAGDNQYSRTERNQLQQLAALVAAQPPAALVVVCGDFNVPRDSGLFHDFLTASALADPLAHDSRPTYRPLPGMPTRFALPIDSALFRVPAGAQFAGQSQLCFGERMPFSGGSGYLSDHLAVELQVTWS